MAQITNTPGKSDRPGASRLTIIVTAPTATEADALATTLAVANKAEQKVILDSFPNAEFEEIQPS